MNAAIDRRKFIAISAAAAGLSALPFGARNNAATGHLVEWRGTCLGAVATLRVHHPDESAARDLVRQAVAEADRLEDVFSLYREDSALCQLNRHGFWRLLRASCRICWSACNHYWEITGGVFDPTVQALWRCYAESFSTNGRRADNSRKRGRTGVGRLAAGALRSRPSSARAFRYGSHPEWDCPGIHNGPRA